MCGISALINTNNTAISPNLIRKMNDLVKHRGPDDGGVFLKDNFALGNRRLAVIDTSQAGHQPFIYGANALIYNGAIYNFVELRKELEKRGYIFKSSTDTEVILAAYDCWGQQCVERFSGMWSFVLYDHGKNILFCSRDRFGIKPLHFARIGHYFAIGSEIKQFSAIPGYAAKMNNAAAFNFLNYNALNYSEDTFFEGISTLRGGNNLVYDLRTHTYNTYNWYGFDQQAENSDITFQEATTTFHDLFSTAVDQYTRCNVQYGAFLSGGLDSSSIVCMLKQGKRAAGDLTTVSLCWHYKNIDEQHYIDPVLEETGFYGKKLYADMNEMNKTDVLDRIIYSQDQPIPNASHFAEYKLHEGARRAGMTVMMDGQGSDEYLAGYGIFGFYHLLGLMAKRKWSDIRREWPAFKGHQSFSHWQLLRFLMYIRYRQPVPQIDPAIKPAWGKDLLARSPFMLPEGVPMDIRNFSFQQLFVSSLPYQLHSADRNSMHHSIESRFPFLDHRLVEFAFSLPDTFKINNGATKFVLRESMKSILPECVRLRRQKLGLPAPEREWMLANADWVEHELAEGSAILDEMVNATSVKKRFQSFRQLKYTDHSFFFRVIALSRWVRLFGVSLS